jgi:hypothetical protein
MLGLCPLGRMQLVRPEAPMILLMAWKQTTLVWREGSLGSGKCCSVRDDKLLTTLRCGNAFLCCAWLQTRP